MTNRSEIKIIFVDIDWTLYDHQKKQFIASGLRALKKARKNGVKVIICSGRHYYSIQGLGAFDAIPHDGYICTNGGIAFADGKYIIINVIDPKTIYKVIELCKKHHLGLQLMRPDSAILVGEETDFVKWYFEGWVETRPPHDEYKGEEITSCLLYCTEESEKYFKNIKAHINRFYDQGMDIYAKEYSKDQGVQAILDYYSFSKDEAMAFGDDIPDIDMFKCVKYSIAMGNAKDELKKSSFHVTDHIAKHGLRKALKKYKVI